MTKKRLCCYPRRGIAGSKTIRVMKLSFLLTFLVTLTVSANVNLLSQQVNLDFENAQLRDVLKSLKEQTGHMIIYSESRLESETARISVNAHNVSLEKALDMVLRGLPYTYKIEEQRVMIIPRPAGQQALQPPPAKATVGGIVTSETKHPLAGVTVMIKGTLTGTITDAKGEYSIPVTDGQTIVFTFIGRTPQEIVYNGQERINAVLQEDASEIDEVVVTGYQRIDRKNLTSAIDSYKYDDLKMLGVSTLDGLFEGRILDMTFTTNSGEVGVVPKLRIRGTSTLIGNREPLWVVDGIVISDPVSLSADVLNDPDYINRIGNAIAGINPQDIERIDVLKDAAATTLYGTKAANGVIVVTTKSGFSGPPVISYSASTTLKLRPRYSDKNINLMNGRERLELSRDLTSIGYIFPGDMNPVGYEYLLQELYAGRINDAQFAAEVHKLENTNTDWFDILTHDSFSQDHTVNISGGSDKVRYYASVGYNRTNDVIKNQFNDRYTSMINLNAKLYSWLNASLSVKGSIAKRQYQQEGINSIDYAYNTSRLIPAFDENGEYHYYTKKHSTYSAYNYNILNEIDNSSNTQRNNSLTTNAKLDFQMTGWLRANVQFSYSTQDTNQENEWGEKSWYAASLRQSEYGVEPEQPTSSELPFGGIYTYANTRNNSYTLRAQVDANHYFGAGRIHNINASIGYEMSSVSYEGYRATTRGYYPDRGRKFATGSTLTEYITYNNWLLNNAPTITDNLTNTLGAYATATYSYGNLFNLNANVRFDGSNQFGSRSNEKLLPVWSVSGSLNISELGAVRDVTWINYMRLKASYGFQGNMLDGQTPELVIVNNTKDTYYNSFTSSVSSFPNPDLKWEKTGSFNLGLEMSLFDNRVQLSGDYYRKRTNDAYMEKNISTVNGRSSYIINGGVVQNNGFNVELTVVPIQTRFSKWVISTGFSKVYNRLDASAGAESYELSNFLDGTALVKGQPVGTFYSYRFIGLSPVDGGPLFDDYSDYIERLVGMSKYETYTSVLSPSGKREPSISGNINTSYTYKNLRVSAVVAYSMGAKIRRMSIQQQTLQNSTSRVIYPEFNASRELLDRWKVPGDERTTNIPALISSADPNYYAYNTNWSYGTAYAGTGAQPLSDSEWDKYDYSDLRVVSADYLKLSSLAFTYSLPQKVLDRTVFSRMEFTLSGTNLFTITHKALRGQTPTQSIFQAVQLSERPTFSFGINLSF